MIKKILALIATLATLLTAFGTLPTQAEETVKPDVPEFELQVSKDESTFTFTISKTANADGYRIYAKEPGSTKYRTVATIKKSGKKVRVVSAPSEGLFRLQPQEYQDSVLPPTAKIFGMTAGLPCTLEGLVGRQGRIWGMESFGFSAPYKVLDEKLGYNGENVCRQVLDMLA